MSLRVAFMGTPDFALPALQALIDMGHQVVAVYTRAPKPKGRGHEVQKTPVHLLAEQHGIEVRTPKTLRDEAEQQKFAALNLDIAIVAAYGLILPKPVLDAPKAGCLNLHASLLPRWRGAAPIQRAIMAGDAESGVCLMDMEEGLDTGGVYARGAVPITATTTGQSLHDALSGIGGELLKAHLADIASGKLACTPQPEEGVTYAQKIEKAEARIDWSLPAIEIERKLRAFTPWPASEFVLNGETLKLLRAELVNASGKPGELLDDQFTIACGQGALRLLTVQRPGRGPVDGAAFLRGLRPNANTSSLVSPARDLLLRGQ